VQKGCLLSCLGIAQVAYSLSEMLHLMRLRTGAHHLAIETDRWQRPVVPQDARCCFRYTRHAIEDESHVKFECPACQQIRLMYGSVSFYGLEDNLQSAIRVLTREPGKVPYSINDELKVVTPFVTECLHKHWQSEDDPVSYEDVDDTFSLPFPRQTTEQGVLASIPSPVPSTYPQAHIGKI
jgi:hypothetical protein